MKLLLDTHIWLWSLLEPEKLSGEVAEQLESEENELWLSPTSVWETLILAAKGRLDLQPSPEEWIQNALRRVPMKDAPLNREVAFRSRSLPVPDQDPADRFLAATAVVYELTLVTADRNLLAVEGLSVLAN